MDRRTKENKASITTPAEIKSPAGHSQENQALSREPNGRQLDAATWRCDLHRELVVRVNAMAKVLCFYFSMFLEDPLHINHWKLDGEREPPVPPTAIHARRERVRHWRYILETVGCS